MVARPGGLSRDGIDRSSDRVIIPADKEVDMIRCLLLAACLASAFGCAASRKVTDGKPADPPKEYPYKDLSAGTSAFSRR